MDADDPFDQLAPRSRTVPRRVMLRVGVGAAVLLLIGAFAIAVLVGMLSPHGESSDVPAVTITSAASVTATPTVAAVLYVHVLGAVTHPGLYTLPTGSRVVDAVGAAGGMTHDADQSGVNLARQLSDGEQLIVPHVGETVTSPVGSANGAAGAGGIAGGKVNLNTATETELETLPRVGPAMAAKILDWRTQNGRFTSVEDLMNISGVGQKTFDALKDQVTV